MCGFQVDRCTSKAYERRAAFPHAARKWRILHVCIYMCCAKKENEKFFDEARLETNAPPLYCGVVPNICDRNPILLRFVIGQSGIVLQGYC